MESHEKVLTVKPAAWGADADRLIPLAVQNASTAEVRAQVEKGVSSLFHVMHAGLVVGAYVLRVESTAEGLNEGVVVTAAGRLDGIDLIESLLPVIEQQFKGCHTLRFHTARAALARRLCARGFSASELVCRKTIP